MLSKQAIDLLDENGYRYSFKNDLLYIKHSSSDRIFLLILGTFLALGCMAFAAAAPIAGGIALLLVLGIFIPSFLRTPGKSVLKIDLKNHLFHLNDFKKSLSEWTSFNLESEFVSEYSSAFKKTTEEHHIRLVITFEDGENFTLLTIKSDYPEPPEAMVEIKDLLDRLVVKKAPDAV